MYNKRVLFISSEVMPYFPESPQSKMSIKAPKIMNSIPGYEVRVFMPRFGIINERRHQLHEVIRLSGINLIINDIDRPLIIKVASMPKERLQVYFIDNDEYFKRKKVYSDARNQLLEDNDERMIFFTKGILETMKKLNWVPDIIHVHGWFCSLIPLYLKTHYKDDPVFMNSKVVSSIYDNGFEGSLNKKMVDKLIFDFINLENIENLTNPTYEELINTMVRFSDAIMRGSESLPTYLEELLNSQTKPILPFTPINKLADEYNKFYHEEVLNEV